ncbi:SCO family protein [Leptospira sp. 2 VSF19]|uniref:SCO family protein n=1 Tax=Leptospira soteropolitanensis TaxID=2950025 RepID=A0AAW5VJ74_9LEPT|nr:SCO family protein [Leptospira soteropolitanensis]MCW7493814.1 SCO family protein [Leptospira soteropolitanensis]MCW7501409.1 SCO family protein [Leptospira soteropolitanensis]MCW7523828.1 SCO family protein [Leptospira soteropolitanensis]MCW7527693.1 SCO family protein [Leptospira soteropolitanensis]MCW7531546.1 SCO family protein [Leptospira soteropolitanensis]
MKLQSTVKLLILFITFAFNFGCDEQNSSGHHHHAEDHVLAASDAAQGSLFDLGSQWTTESNQTITLKHFKGSPLVISMFYATCQSICPRLVADMEQLAKKILKKTGKEPRMVLVSFDSEKDNPAVLNAYKKKMNLKENWTLLSGKEEDIRMLSVVLGINYKKISNGEFNHSAVYSLVSKEGVVISRIEGIGSNSEGLISEYQKLK